MNILMMDSRLTTIKTLKDAQEVLEAVREQGGKLLFKTSETQRAVFEPKDDEYTVWEPDTALTIDVVFQPAIRMEIHRAVRRLYALRKHYNRHWRD